MPKKIREMTDQEFRQYIAEGKELKAGDNLERILESDYADRDWDDQQDFILRMMQIQFPTLQGLSLDQMREIITDDEYDVEDIWDEIRLNLNAINIRRHAKTLAIAVFGAYMKEEPSKRGKDTNAVVITKRDITDAVNYVSAVKDELNKKGYINPVQLSIDEMKREALDAVSKASQTPQDPNTAADPEAIKNFTDTFAYEVVTDPNTGLVKFGGVPQPIGSVLTEDIINTGNPEMLKEFAKAHEKELNRREKRYLNYKIKVAEKLDRLEKDAVDNIAWGDDAGAKKTLDVDLDSGYTGFSKLRLNQPQSSDNGCWSCAYSLLLESRGIILSQENIRAFRPDYRKDTPPQDKATKDLGLRLNSDRVNNIFENADLLMKVAPNTTMSQMVLNPVETDGVTVTDTNGNTKFLSEQQKVLFKDYYISRTVEQLKKVINDAINIDRSPVALNWNDHYVTITGIDENGNVRVEDSAKSMAGQHTRFCSLQDIAEECLFGKDTKNGVIRSKGLGLVWLKDIEPIDYEKRIEDSPRLLNDAPELFSTDEMGNLKVEVPFNHPKYSSTGKPANGQVSGSGVSANVMLDQKLSNDVFGGQIGNFEPGAYFMGNIETYYPGKLNYRYDPRVLKDGIDKGNENIAALHTLMDNALYELHKRHGPIHWEDFEKYQDALRKLNISKSRETKENALETLRELHDLFRTKTDDGKTYYEVLESALLPQSREQFGRLWIAIDRGGELNLDMEGLLAETEEARRLDASVKAPDFAPQSPYEDFIRTEWSKLESCAQRRAEKKEYLVSLSKIIAASEIYDEKIISIQNDPKPLNMSTVEISNRAEEIMQTRSFQILMSQDHYKELAASGDRYKMINELEEINHRLSAMAASDKLDSYAYTHANYKNKHKQLRKLYNEVNKTEKGSIWGLGIISRDENTPKYSRALAALDKLSDNHLSPMSGADVFICIEDIKEYLKGKEEKRGTGYGQTRWNCFMAALADVMPRKEFEEYCDEINRIRGVSNDPFSSDYVGPENFYTKKDSLGDIMNDTLTRINDGKATVRDYARLIALRQIGVEKAGGQGEFLSDKKEFGRTKLRKITDAIMMEDDFKNFMKWIKPDELKAMLAQPNAAGISGYREFAVSYFREHHPEQQPNNKAAAPKAPSVTGSASKKQDPKKPTK